MKDLIDRQAALDTFGPWLNVEGYSEGELNMLRAVLYELKTLPTAQPDLPEAYAKKVWTWLLDYQTTAAELKAKYSAYEVLSWVVNDWRRGHGGLN